MTRQLSYLSVLVLLAVAAGLAGCTGLVQVVDPAGRPVPDAGVVAVGLSMNSEAAITNSAGEVHLPSVPHDAKWVQVSRYGFRTVQVEISDTWPMRVMLVPTPRP